MLAWLYWDPPREFFRIPILQHPIVWYGVIFAVGFYIGYLLLISLMKQRFPQLGREEAKALVERLSLYVIIGTVVGARLGHILFYDSPSSYLSDPLSILRTWEGGLASHGGVLGVLIATSIFFLRVRKLYPFFSLLNLIDLMVISAAFLSGCIRVGNFCNQEILGKMSYLPWAVIFGHAADGSPPLPRHPAQLYEALFYFLLFAILMMGWKRWTAKGSGICAGWFLSLTFGFRFLIEFVKEEESAIISGGLVNMGQILSIPIIVLGVVFLLRHKTRRKRYEGESAS
jgi:phosphatidylglycerol---prolipoprotein diacylglyceryl transferase